MMDDVIPLDYQIDIDRKPAAEAAQPQQQPADQIQNWKRRLSKKLMMLHRPDYAKPVDYTFIPSKTDLSICQTNSGH